MEQEANTTFLCDRHSIDQRVRIATRAASHRHRALLASPDVARLTCAPREHGLGSRLLEHALVVITGLALHSCPSLSLPPSDARRKELIALAIRDVAEAGPKGAESVAAATLADDCCTVYSGFNEHRIRDIPGSMSAARHIVTVQWNGPRHTHLYAVSLGDDLVAIDITDH